MRFSFVSLDKHRYYKIPHRNFDQYRLRLNTLEVLFALPRHTIESMMTKMSNRSKLILGLR